MSVRLLFKLFDFPLLYTNMIPEYIPTCELTIKAPWEHFFHTIMKMPPPFQGMKDDRLFQIENQLKEKIIIKQIDIVDNDWIESKIKKINWDCVLTYIKEQISFHIKNSNFYETLEFNSSVKENEYVNNIITKIINTDIHIVFDLETLHYKPTETGKAYNPTEIIITKISQNS